MLIRMLRVASLALGWLVSMVPLAVQAGQAPAPTLCAVATQAVEAQGRRQALAVSAECREHAVEANGVDSASISLARPVGLLRTGPMQLVLRVQTPGARAELIAVTLDLRVWSPAWTLSREVRQGERLQSPDLVRQDYEWPAGVTPQATSQEMPRGRARRAMHAGQPVMPTELLSDEELLHGEKVTVLIREGEVTLRAPARVVADTKLGGAVRAQLNGRREVVEGVLVDMDTVLVGPRSQ